MMLTVCACLLFAINIEAAPAPKPQWFLPTLPPLYPDYQPPIFPPLPPIYQPQPPIYPLQPPIYPPQPPLYPPQPPLYPPQPPIYPPQLPIYPPWTYGNKGGESSDQRCPDGGNYGCEWGDYGIDCGCYY